MKRKKTSETSGLQDRNKIRRSNLRSTREQIVYFVIFLLFVAVSLYVDRDSQGYFPETGGKGKIPGG